jgi:hypothetical protein
MRLHRVTNAQKVEKIEHKKHVDGLGQFFNSVHRKFQVGKLYSIGFKLSDQKYFS